MEFSTGVLLVSGQNGFELTSKDFIKEFLFPATPARLPGPESPNFLVPNVKLVVALTTGSCIRQLPGPPIFLLGAA